MFESFTQDDWIQLAIGSVLAALPALIWSYIIFSGRKSSRWPLLLAFFLGTLTVVPLLLLYDFLWVKFPQLNVYNAIESSVQDLHYAAVLTLIVVGALEELAKSGVVRIIAKTRIGIQTINDAVKYSILAGLGFAFTENIFYFREAWLAGGVMELLPVLIFRSVFTVCAHMVFSGIFGYYYGIAKFAQPIMEARLWMRERSMGVRILAKILGDNEAKAFSSLMLLKGLFIAMAVHAAFNSFLEFNMFFPVLVLVGVGFAYLLYLLAHKTGAIVFASTGQTSSMTKRDVDTVLELLGMWTKEERYKDVVDICQRLLLRDPDNKVVQLFQAKAMEKQKLTDLEKSFTSLFESDEKKVEEGTLRNLVKQKVLMEMLREKQASYAVSATPAPMPAPTPAPRGPRIPQVPGLGSPQNDPSSPQGSL